jgi:hypothetical protein
MAEKARILVVANRTALCGQLRDAMLERAGRGPAEFVLLVPATAHGLTQAVNPDEEADEIASQEERALESLRGAGLDVVEGKLGDAEPLAAVEDELNLHGPYDEIIVSTLPKHLSKWLRVDLVHKVKALTDRPVTHVVGQEAETPA